jgi:Mitochondrial carrier protein.
MGLYRVLYEKMMRSREGQPPNLLQKAACALGSGITGCVAAHPTDLVLVRFQNDGLLPKDQRRNYKNFFDAARRMIKEEGVVKMWNGVSSNMGRSGLITCGQLATYDQVKQTMENKYQMNPNTMKCRIICATIASLVASFMGCPFDNMKVRL